MAIRQARSIKSLAAAVKTVVWRGGEAGSPCCEWWAPELHFVDGTWYIYTTADDGNNNNHRLQVLQATDPMAGTRAGDGDGKPQSVRTKKRS